jgi:hypothetical protein
MHGIGYPRVVPHAHAGHDAQLDFARRLHVPSLPIRDWLVCYVHDTTSDYPHE